MFFKYNDIRFRNRFLTYLIIKLYPIVLSILFIAACSYIETYTSLEPDRIKNTNISWIVRNKLNDHCLHPHLINIYSVNVNSNIDINIGTAFPNSIIFTGTPFVPFFPNIGHYASKLFGKKRKEFFIDFTFKANSSPITLNLSAISFYHLTNNFEIGIDSVLLLKPEDFCFYTLKKANLGNLVKSGDSSQSMNKIIVFPEKYIRFCLKLNTYDLDGGLIIKFSDSFIINNNTKINDVTLIKTNILKYLPLYPDLIN